MPPEMNLFSVELPTLIPLLLLLSVMFWILDSLLARLDVYTWIWHPSLFRLGLFISLYSAIGLWILHRNGVAS